MQKFLRTMMLLALFAVPFASQAQTAHTLTVADGTTTNSNVPIHGLWADAYLRCQTIYPASEISAAAGDYMMTGGSISSLTYYLSSVAAEAWTGTWEVKIMETSATTLSAFADMTGATSVYTGTLNGTSSPMTITFSTPYTYAGGNLIVEVSQTTSGNYKSASFVGVTHTGASWQGYNSSAWASITGSAQNFIPKTTFTFTGGTEVTCPPVNDLAVSNITSTSATLTWSGNASGYTVYEYANTDSADWMYTDTFAVFNTLLPNTEYTFGVVSDCGADGESAMRSVTFRTACAAMSLPYNCGFEADELQGNTTNMERLPWCATRYNNSTNTTYNAYPFSSTSYAHSGSRALYFYGSASSGADTMALILPELDVDTYPMNANRLTFWARLASSGSKNAYVGTMSDPADITTFTLVDSANIATTTHTLYSVPLTAATATNAYVAIVVFKGTGAIYMDDLTLEEMPSCMEVSNVAIVDSLTTSSSITISWSDTQNPTGTTYTVYNMADTSDTYATIIGNVAVIENLDADAQYTFGVQANCAAGDANFMTVSGRTACATMTMPWSENFDNWTAKSPCWSFLSGAYNMGAGTPTASASAWSLNTSYGNYITISGKALTMNIYSTNRYWAVTPAIELTSSDAVFSFDVAVAAWSAATPNYDANDTLAVAISTDNGSTYNTLMVLDNTALNALGNTYTTITVPLDTYDGDTVRIAVFAGSSASGGDNRIVIDNFYVGEPASCPAPAMLAVSDITSSGATLSWVGNAASYSIYDMDDPTVVLYTVNDTSVSPASLSPNTMYTFGVVANCSGETSDTVTVTFRTLCDALYIPFTEGFEETSGTVACWSIDGSGSWTVGTGDYNTTTGAFEGTLNAKITHSSTGNATKLISPVLDLGNAAGMQLVFAHVQRAWSGDIDELRVLTRTAIDDDWDTVATYTDAYATWTVETLNLTGSIYQVAFEMTDHYGYGVGIDSVVFNLPASCLPVTDLTVDSTTSTSVYLSWNGTATAYNIYSATGLVIASGVTTTNYEVTGLNALTAYTFGVTAVCGTDESDVTTVNAVTACAGETCFIEINGADSYGDGWNGNAINISQNGAVIGTFTIDTGSVYSEQFSVCSGSPVTFTWVAGNYPGETSFEIKDGGGAIVFTGVGSASMATGDTLVTIDNACPSCATPVISVDNVTETTVTISWTGSSASYDVYNGTTFVATVSTNSYTFTGLNASSAYTFGVQAICSATDSSSVATINVMTSCADVTSLPYFEGFENGLACWTSVNGSSDGVDWTAQPSFSQGSITPHTGNYMAASWSWNNLAMHADAWLISPKFILPTVAAGDSLTFSWWERTNSNYADSYSVVLSTTTNDTAAFTTVLRPYDTAAGSWTLQSVDLTAYAGQSIYVAFHHVDYDENYLLIDDINLFQGAYVPPAPDTVTVTFAVNDATMGTTIPAPGTYEYLSGDTIFFGSQANAGHRFAYWVISYSGVEDVDTLDANYANGAYMKVNTMLSYGINAINFTAFFEAGNPDSIAVTYAVNDATMGTTTPAPGTHYVYVGNDLLIEALPNNGYMLSAWVYDFYMNGNIFVTDTIFSDAEDFENPKNFGTVAQNYVTYGITVTLTAIFDVDTTTPLVNYYTVNVNYDATMGTVTGVPTEAVAEGTVVTLNATPNAGYEFVNWQVGNEAITDNPYTFTVTSDVVINVNFREKVGIDDVDEADVIVYSTDTRIFVRGAEGRDVYVYDINGRMMAKTIKAGESLEYNMPASGVYIVKIDAITKRVVVIR